MLFLTYVLVVGTPARAVTPQSLKTEVRLDQNVGEQIPPGLAFTDENGRDVRIGDYFGATPSIMVLAYYSCPNLCPAALRHLTQGLNGISAVAGRDFQIIVVSFDPRDTASLALRAKDAYVRGYRWDNTGRGWHFLTGSPGSVGSLEQAVGFHAVWDQKLDCFAHPTGAIVLDLNGRIAHCCFGTDYSPADLAAALHDASASRSSWVDQVEQQYCLSYDPQASHYGKMIFRTLRIGSALWVIGLLSYIGAKLRADFAAVKVRPSRPSANRSSPSGGLS